MSKLEDRYIEAFGLLGQCNAIISNFIDASERGDVQYLVAVLRVAKEVQANLNKFKEEE